MQKIIIGSEYSDELISLVKNSKKYIKILVFDWRWYDSDLGSSIQKFNYELIRARKRGVAIEAVADKCNGYNQFKNEGIDIKLNNSGKLMHIKIVIVDGEKMLIGSHNLTKNAFEINHEISVLLDDPDIIIKSEQFFNSMT